MWNDVEYFERSSWAVLELNRYKGNNPINNEDATQVEYGGEKERRRKNGFGFNSE